jgi:hypothetical protein
LLKANYSSGLNEKIQILIKPDQDLQHGCLLMNSVADPDPVGSGHIWSDPGPDPDVWDQIRIRIRILAFINGPKLTFLMCVKDINTKESLFLNFLSYDYTFSSTFPPKKFSEEIWPKSFKGQDPNQDRDPVPDSDVFESRIRIRSKIVLIRNTACLLFGFSS